MAVFPLTRGVAGLGQGQRDAVVAGDPPRATDAEHQ